MTRVLGARRHLLLSLGLRSRSNRLFLQRTQPGVFALLASCHGFWGGAFLVRTVILLRLMFPGKSVLSPFPGSTWNSISLQSFTRLPWVDF